MSTFLLLIHYQEQCLGRTSNGTAVLEHLLSPGLSYKLEVARNFDCNVWPDKKPIAPNAAYSFYPIAPVALHSLWDTPPPKFRALCIVGMMLSQLSSKAADPAVTVASVKVLGFSGYVMVMSKAAG